MEVWTVVLALWLSTWAMCYGRTISIITYMVKETEGGELIVGYKYTHMIIYGATLFILAPLIWQVAVFDKPRARWCTSYVKAICRRDT